MKYNNVGERSIKVSFSTYSQLKRCIIARPKAYSSSEQKAMKLQALQDAGRIHALINSCPYQGARGLRYLVTNHLLQTEELLGIEHLIADPKKVAEKRQKHKMMVMNAQEHLKKANGANGSIKLADIARLSNVDATKRAQLRAILATV